MTSFRQIEANRRNALRSTGPVTEEGKRRSRHNALRHGLTAETVVETVEDIEDYRGFEAAVIASYDARDAVERDLVLRLASLLWRLRRATAIETELLRIQVEVSRDFRFHPGPTGRHVTLASGFERACSLDQEDRANQCEETCDAPDSRPPASPSRELACCFLRLIHIDPGAFERLGRYESALSRQLSRTIVLLRSARIR